MRKRLEIRVRNSRLEIESETWDLKFESETQNLKVTKSRFIQTMKMCRKTNGFALFGVVSDDSEKQIKSKF